MPTLKLDGLEAENAWPIAEWLTFGTVEGRRLVVSAGGLVGLGGSEWSNCLG